jgi:hypothetical protein
MWSDRNKKAADGPLSCAGAPAKFQIAGERYRKYP